MNTAERRAGLAAVGMARHLSDRQNRDSVLPARVAALLVDVLADAARALEGDADRAAAGYGAACAGLARHFSEVPTGDVPLRGDECTRVVNALLNAGNLLEFRTRTRTPAPNPEPPCPTTTPATSSATPTSATPPSSPPSSSPSPREWPSSPPPSARAPRSALTRILDFFSRRWRR